MSTFDGKEYFFSGGCEYIMMKAEGNDSEVLVTRKDEPCSAGGRDFCPRNLTILIPAIGGDRKRQGGEVEFAGKIKIEVTDKGKVLVNTNEVNLPYTDPINGKYQILYVQSKDHAVMGMLSLKKK